MKGPVRLGMAREPQNGPGSERWACSQKGTTGWRASFFSW